MVPVLCLEKQLFLYWLKNIDMPEEVEWILLGDFNLLRSPSDRNRPGGDINEMLVFNEAISVLGVVELPLMDRKFTWSNKQFPPLLERLDWFFTSISWTNNFPGTTVSSLTNETSDHLSNLCCY